MKTLQEIINEYVDTSTDHDRLLDALMERENEAADFIRLAGAKFSLMPPIVQQVIVRAGLGTPITDEEQALLDAQTLAMINEGRRQFGEMTGQFVPLLDSLPDDLFGDIGDTTPEEGPQS